MVNQWVTLLILSVDTGGLLNKPTLKPALTINEKALNIAAIRRLIMRTIKFTFWQDGEFFIGFLNEYPDYQTQGMHKEELAENLKDLLNDLESGHVPYVRKVEELMVA
jgi:hypothetical protein